MNNKIAGFLGILAILALASQSCFALTMEELQQYNAAKVLSATTVSLPLHLNAGGPSYLDRTASNWTADDFYSGGTAIAPGLPVFNSTNSTLYQTARTGNFSYTFSGLANASYSVTLHFDEPTWSSAGQRVFNVSINGQPVLQNFDIVKDAGGRWLADDKTFTVNVTTNSLVINFVAVVDSALINGIEISTVSTPVDTTPPVISAVAASQTTASTTQISWTTNEPADTQVNYGLSSAYGQQTTLSTNLVTSHAATLLGLSPATVYHYRVRSQDAAGNLTLSSDNTFTTASLPTSSSVITACQSINSSGSYVLGNNLSAPSGQTCLNVHDTSNVQLDCKNFSITSSAAPIVRTYSLLVSNVPSFSLSNCQLIALNVTSTQNGYALVLSNSPGATISKNTITGGLNVEVDGSNGLNFTGNTLNIPLIINNSNNAIVAGNASNLPGNVFSYANLQLASSTGSTVSGNQFSGGWDGTSQSQISQFGADDGIILQDVTSSVIKNNTVANYWDAGIELVHKTTNTQISGNTIVNAFVAGIGGWDYNSMTGNTISGNSVSGSKDLFLFKRTGVLLPGEQTVYFLNNTFSDNTFSRPLTLDSSTFDFTSDGNGLSPSQFVLGNNTFVSDNFLPTTVAPTFEPASMIIDGGGNTCGTLNAAPDFPLHCVGTQPPPPPGDNPPTGHLDGFKTDGTVFGWAEDPDNTTTPVNVQIYVDQNAGTASPIATISASVFRSDVGNHAFNFSTPTVYQDGKQHTVWVWAVDLTDSTGAHNAQLPGSPLTFTWTAAQQPPSGCAPASNAFTGCYYGTTDLSGLPVFTRTDPAINFNWFYAQPSPSVPRQFSARWQGNFNFTAGMHRFAAVTSDGMRVYIDGNLMLNRWLDQSPNMYIFAPTLTAGTHNITVEYYQNTGSGTAQLSWQ